jgi:hypothetical protein
LWGELGTGDVTTTVVVVGNSCIVLGFKRKWLNAAEAFDQIKTGTRTNDLVAKQ